MNYINLSKFLDDLNINDKSLNLLNEDPKPEGGSNIGIIIGSICVAIAILLLIWYLCKRNSRNSSKKTELVNETSSYVPPVIDQNSSKEEKIIDQPIKEEPKVVEQIIEVQKEEEPIYEEPKVQTRVELVHKNLVSRYNEDYYCVITHFDFLRDQNILKVGVDTHGNMSLGECQNPDSSTFRVGGERMTRINSEYSRYSVYNGFTGEIIYEWSGQNGEMTFSFGIEGYSEVTLGDIV